MLLFFSYIQPVKFMCVWCDLLAESAGRHEISDHFWSEFIAFFSHHLMTSVHLVSVSNECRPLFGRTYGHTIVFKHTHIPQVLFGHVIFGVLPELKRPTFGWTVYFFLLLPIIANFTHTRPYCSLLTKKCQINASKLRFDRIYHVIYSQQTK